MLPVLAWRNLWRNVHRTLITAGSVFFAVILVLFTRSMQLGTYDHMVRSTLSVSTGYLQIQALGFWTERSLDNSIEEDLDMAESIRQLARVTAVVPRLESFALASFGDRTRGVMVTGIDPGQEDRMSNLSQRITAGRYLHDTSQGLLVSQRLSEFLRISVGDSLVLFSQGYQATMAAGIFPVEGIVDLPVPDLNAGIVYLPLQTAQWFYVMPGRITSWALMLRRPGDLNAIRDTVTSLIASDHVLLSWREMLPELVQSIEIDNAGGVLMLGILYIVIGFGIFGTAMMMTAERTREFAILISVGMKRWRLSAMVLFECITIGALGALAGAIASIPVLLYMRAHPIRLTGRAAQAMLEYGYEPIIPFLVEPGMFLRQALMVAFLSTLAGLYPVWALSRLKVSSALH